jgi:hypothetical protein
MKNQLTILMLCLSIASYGQTGLIPRAWSAVPVGGLDNSSTAYLLMEKDSAGVHRDYRVGVLALLPFLAEYGLDTTHINLWTGKNTQVLYNDHGNVSSNPGFKFDSAGKMFRAGFGFNGFDATGFVANGAGGADSILGVGGLYVQYLATGGASKMVTVNNQGWLFYDNIPTGTVTSVSAGAGLSGGTWTTSGTVSMPNVGTAGTYGDATHIPAVTTDAQGRVSGVTTYTFAAAAPAGVNVGDIQYNNGSVFGGTINFSYDPGTGNFFVGDPSSNEFISTNSSSGQYDFGSPINNGCKIRIDDGAKVCSLMNFLGTGYTIPFVEGSVGQVFGITAANTGGWLSALNITTICDTLALSATAALRTITPPSGTHDYEIGGVMKVISYSAGAMTYKVTFTDENGTVQNQSIFPQGVTSATISGVGYFCYPTLTITAKSSGTITTSIQIAGGSGISYNVHCTIKQLN